MKKIAIGGSTTTLVEALVLGSKELKRGEVLMEARISWLVLAAAGLFAPPSVPAESTARQRFLVNVPARLSIKSPPDGPKAELVPDESQVEFRSQTWEVSANSHSGAMVQFSTEQSFHNLDDDSIRRDAQLNVSIVSETRVGAWSVVKSQAATAHQAGHEEATVEVRSVKPGSAEIGLTVTFLQGADQATPGGDYVTTVVGTITAN